jgi:hypothetical protein
MIGLAQTQSYEIMKVFLSDRGRTSVKCPFCKKHHDVSVPEGLRNKPVRAKCECGRSFPVLFDGRGHFRKEVRLPGEYWNTSGEKDLMTVTTVSATGAGFDAARSKPFVALGETVQVRFMLNDNHNTWITAKAIIKRVHRNRIGIEFIGLDCHQQKCLGFYLMA